MIDNLESWNTQELRDQLLHNRNNMKVVEIQNARIVEILENRIKDLKEVMYND
jgi:hypothetical protein